MDRKEPVFEDAKQADPQVEADPVISTEIYNPPQSDLNVGHIATPENQLARPSKRYQAQFLDGLISLAIFFIGINLQQRFGQQFSIPGYMPFVLPIAYFTLADALPNGSSLGKIPFGMAVVDTKSTKPCTLFQSFVRNFLTPILGVFDAVFIFGTNHQRLGDHLAGTIVIQKNRPRPDEP